jgi:hypothetical protein
MKSRAYQSGLSAAEWMAHEHMAAPLHVQAHRLIEQAGSPELAKQAIDAAAQALLAAQQSPTAPDKLSPARHGSTSAA